MISRLPALLALTFALLGLPSAAGAAKTPAPAKAAKPTKAEKAALDSAAAAELAFRNSQEFASQKFIYTLLAGNLDSLKAMFAEDIRANVTPQAMEYMRSQYKWFYDIVGGDFELFASGWRDSISYFREYRIANETNERYPLILVQVVFPDTVSTTLVGAQVKNFLGGDEKRVTGEHSWVVGQKTYDVHSIIVAQIDSGNIMAIQYFEDDTNAVTQAFVSDRGIPLVKEALARGYRDSALTLLDGKPLMKDVGVVFIRKDRQEGLIQIKVSFRPEDFGEGQEADKPKNPAKKAKTKKK